MQPVKTTLGHVLLPTSMVDEARRDAESLRRLEHRLRTDPEFAAEWSRRRAELDREYDDYDD
jgi:hypothetical protein